MNIRERTGQLLADADSLHRELFGERIRYLELKYGEKEVTESFLKVFWNLFDSFRMTGNQKAASLGICYLDSSVSQRTYELSLILFGEDFYLEEQPFGILWRPEYLFDTFETDMKEIMIQLGKKYARICRWEEDAVRFHCIEYYYAALCKLCKDRIKEILCGDSYTSMNKADDFFVFFGRYRGVGEILSCMESDRIGE